MGGETHINMVSYGGGVNSTALLVGLHQHRIPVDLILFADTGAEHPHTYAYLDIMDRWLKDHGMPPITRVYKTTRDGKRLTLEQECLQSGTLPSMAYGFKRCSLKHKIEPQEKFCNHYPPCQKVWAAGKRVVKFIGYDAGESYRSDKVLLGDLADHKYSKWYPLMEWGWTRDDCIRQIEAAGLPQPGKSSCFFCPSMKAEEIIRLRDHHPDLFRRAIALEDNARPNLKRPRAWAATTHGKNGLERRIAHMATVEKIRRDIEKTKEKISEQQKRLRSLEAQLVEEENLEIVRMVKAVKMDNRELTAFLKAYASGLIALPEGMMEAEASADPGDDMEDSDHEE